jgi:hypothetical protein
MRMSTTDIVATRRLLIPAVALRVGVPTAPPWYSTPEGGRNYTCLGLICKSNDRLQITDYRLRITDCGINHNLKSEIRNLKSVIRNL